MFGLSGAWRPRGRENCLGQCLVSGHRLLGWPHMELVGAWLGQSLLGDHGREGCLKGVLPRAQQEREGTAGT